LGGRIFNILVIQRVVKRGEKKSESNRGKPPARKKRVSFVRKAKVRLKKIVIQKLGGKGGFFVWEKLGEGYHTTEHTEKKRGNIKGKRARTITLMKRT